MLSMMMGIAVDPIANPNFGSVCFSPNNFWHLYLGVAQQSGLDLMCFPTMAQHSNVMWVDLLADCAGMVQGLGRTLGFCYPSIPF